MENYPREYAEKLAESYGQTLDAEGNVTSLGKFEGETWRTIDAYDSLKEGCEDDSFGDVAGANGFWFCAAIRGGETVFCNISENGFVSERTSYQFEAASQDNQEANDRENLIEELEDEIKQAQAEEDGPCDSCLVANINGVRSHEHGCPRYARLCSLHKRLESIEDY
jgi:hypothetical protein